MVYMANAQLCIKSITNWLLIALLFYCLDLYTCNRENVNNTNTNDSLWKWNKSCFYSQRFSYKKSTRDAPFGSCIIILSESDEIILYFAVFMYYAWMKFIYLECWSKWSVDSDCLHWKDAQRIRKTLFSYQLSFWNLSWTNYKTKMYREAAAVLCVLVLLQPS